MKNPKLIDMGGKNFGEWFVVQKAGNTHGGAALWLCRCSCGTESIVVGSDLRNGKSVSCGCKGARATIGFRSTTHGMTGTKIHICWKNMLKRCRDMRNKNYGGKGITVCDEWLKFENFYMWAHGSGYRQDLTIERKKNSLGYNPDNCTWADRKTQARNRSIVKIREDGVSWAEISESNGVPVAIMNNRVASGGWALEKAASAQVNSVRDLPNRDDLTGRFTKGTKKWRR
jgi:hypothetical protein